MARKTFLPQPLTETMLKISCYYEVRFNGTQIVYEKIDKKPPSPEEIIPAC